MPSFENRNPMCYRDREDLDRDDYEDEGDTTYYKDGTSKVHHGGPCGSTCYDENGEEC